MSTGGAAEGASGSPGTLTVLERLRSLCPTVSVGTLTADLMNLGEEVALLERAGVGVVHVDVMDGCFCPMLTAGPWYVRGLRTRLLKDVHLMIREPFDKLGDYAAAGADIITVHLESTVHIRRVLQQIGTMKNAANPASGIVKGLALNPATPLEWLTFPLLEEIDMVVLLAVEPGWSGQKFAPSVLPRLACLKEVIGRSGRDILTCIDGGITKDNITEVAAAGPDLIVAGSAVFDGKAAAENAAALLAAIRR